MLYTFHDKYGQVFMRTNSTPDRIDDEFRQWCKDNDAEGITYTAITANTGFNAEGKEEDNIDLDAWAHTLKNGDHPLIAAIRALRLENKKMKEDLVHLGVPHYLP